MMPYEKLRLRCCRIIGLHPEATETPLDCVRLLDNLGRSRGIAAEMLARELAEFVDERNAASRSDKET